MARVARKYIGDAGDISKLCLERSEKPGAAINESSPLRARPQFRGARAMWTGIESLVDRACGR